MANATGAVSGQVSAACPTAGTGLLGVTVDAFAVGSDDLVGSGTTDGVGSYSIPNLPAGDYTISVLTPLGYTAATSDILVTVLDSQTSVASFSLTCVASSGTPRVAGFWKHQMGVATGGNGTASVDASTLCTYLDAVRAHFNDNDLNQVVVYDASAMASCSEKLARAMPLISATPAGLTTGWGVMGTGPGQFQYPTGLGLDASGNLYVVDNSNNRIQVFTSGGDFLRTWGSTGVGPGQFTNPTYVAVDPAGNVFVDSDQRVQKFAPDGTFLLQIGGPYPFNDPQWGSFVFPTGIASTGTGDILVGDSFQRRIIKFSNNGTFLQKYAPGMTAFYDLPCVEGIAFDLAGNVIFVDSAIFGPNVVASMLKMDLLGNKLLQFAFNPFIGQPNNVEGPHGVAIDAAGKIYVADTWNNRIQVFNPDGTYDSQWGSLGTAYGQFSSPTGIVIDGSGNIYVSDSGNNRIEKFGPGGSPLKVNAPPTPIDRARQNLLSLLLNVAANYLGLSDVISKDGATVSQAITYCDQLIDSPTGDKDLASAIADKVNSGQKVNTGVIPLSTLTIAYARPRQLMEFRAGVNPSAGARSLRFTLASPAQVDLAVFDASGRRVSHVYAGPMSEGAHSVSWSGTRDDGVRVGQGIYFARLVAGNETEVTRLIQIGR